MGFVTLRVVCFSAKEKGTWRGASLFVRRHPPHSLPGVYRFLPPAYNRAPPTAHSQGPQVAFPSTLFHIVKGYVGYYV